jgi:multidrug efflux pump subunit AcrA (membrane-fusion protein)
MIRKYFLPVLALAGALFAVFVVVRGAKPVPAALPVAAPPRPPFSSYVAGAGIVEASTENIAIGTPVGNIVSDVYVKVGDTVKAGQPLFKLRDTVSQAELEVKRTAVQLAQAKVERLRSLPRPEEVPPLQAKAHEAEATLADQRNLLRLWESVTDKRAVSEEELSRRRYAVAAAEARLESAKADLALLRAGAWKPDIEVAEAEAAAARAEVVQIEAEIERRTIRAPVDGEVMQVKVRLGEYAQPGPLETPLMLLGSVGSLHVRVDVDENDAWRVAPNARAEAALRGNARLRTPLEFVRVEPFVVPKKSLTGDSTERVDTRVLQVIYRFPRGKIPVYVGQQMDVFIEAPPVDPEAAAVAPAPEASPAGVAGGGDQ